MKRYLRIIALALSLLLMLGMCAMAEPTDPTDPPTTGEPVTPPTTTDPTDAPTNPPETSEPSEKPVDPTAKPACEHDYVFNNHAIPASCTEMGIDEYICSKCGDHITYDVPATGHNYVFDNHVLPATCTEMGLDEYICNKCDDHDLRDVDMLPHTPGEWTVVTPAKVGKAGEKQKVCTVCGTILETEVIPALRPHKTNKDDEQPVAEDVPALPYGSIVSDVTRADETYTAQIVEEGENHVLVITADPDEAGAYTLRNLHITDELLAKMAADHIEIVRFVVGTATVEFPVASFTGEVMTAIKADLASPAKEFIVTVDPTATTAEGNPGCSVSASIACEDGSEFDITGVVEGLTVTMNGVAQAVTEAAVYAA